MFKQQIIDQNKQRLFNTLDRIGYVFDDNKHMVGNTVEYVTNYLIGEGVIMPPLMMAEVIYMIIDNEVVKYHITKIEQDNDYSFRFGAYPCENIKPFTKTKYFKESAIDKTVFQDYAEAVKKVKGEDYYE